MKGSSDRPTSLHAKLKELAQIWAIDLSFVGRRLWNKLGPPLQQRDSELTYWNLPTQNCLSDDRRL